MLIFGPIKTSLISDKSLCQFCGMSAFESSEELEKHVKTGHPLYKCLGCDKSFLEFYNFNSHVVNCKSSWKESISSYVIYDCGSCHQFSISLKDLYMHYLKCYAKIQVASELIYILDAEAHFTLTSKIDIFHFYDNQLLERTLQCPEILIFYFFYHKN